MRIEELRKVLESKQLKNVRPVKEEEIMVVSTSPRMKIIGITGSHGKTTTAYIVHKYIQSLGYRSVLYSTVGADSPNSYLKKDEALEVAISSEGDLLSIIKEATAYRAEYLILEINEITLKKGLVKDIDFDVRVLTSLNPKHNEEEYDAKEYIEIKESFFKDINEDSICVIGYQDYDKTTYEEILSLNNAKKLTYSSRYVAVKDGLDPNLITGLLYELDSSLEGIKMSVLINNRKYDLESPMIMSYNALNILGAMTTIEALGLLKEEEFKRLIKELTIEGRCEVYHIKRRTIIIDTKMGNLLQELKTYQNRGQIENIIVVVGSMGTGYENWEERYQTKTYTSKRKEIRKFASKLINDYVNVVYLTEDDNGKEKVEDICNEIASNLNETVERKIIIKREEAIYQAIKESKEKDVILISGRGNRRILCNSEATIKFIKDKEIVEKAVQQIWG